MGRTRGAEALAALVDATFGSADSPITMIEPDISGWTRVGATSNADYFTVEPGILALVPHKGAVDVRATALDNANVINDYGRRAGRPVAVIAFFDRIGSLDSAARRTYSEEADPTTVCAVAMVGGALLGRAMASVFLAIVRPPGLQFRLFGTYDEAVAWGRTLVAEHGAG